MGLDELKDRPREGEPRLPFWKRILTLLGVETGAPASGRGPGTPAVGTGQAAPAAGTGQAAPAAGTGPEKIYRDTPLPPAGKPGGRTPRDGVPDRLRQLRRMYGRGVENEIYRARNFFQQAVFMQDYEDTVPWSDDFGGFDRRIPTYQDLTLRQLRGYFTWRAAARKGDYQPIPAAIACLYASELLNGVGAASPEDALRKLEAFEKGCREAGIGDERIWYDLRRWKLDYAVLNGVPPETAVRWADPDLIAWDGAMAVLRSPEGRSDGELMKAITLAGGEKITKSPVLTADPERGRHLFCQAWRKASDGSLEGRNLFEICFGRETTRPWYPLAGVVHAERTEGTGRRYVLDECRVFRRASGTWTVTSYEKRSSARAAFGRFLHETDALLRRYLKTGRYLKRDPADEWADPYIEAVLEEDRKAREEAEKPRITIDLSGLDRIRREAAGTRDSLLTAEDEEEEKGASALPPPSGGDAGARTDSREDAGEKPAREESGGTEDLPLDAFQIRILRALLRGEDVSALIREEHRMPSVTADQINEALYEEIGDTAVNCGEDRLSLAEDYAGEIRKLLGEPGEAG